MPLSPPLAQQGLHMDNTSTGMSPDTGASASTSTSTSTTSPATSTGGDGIVDFNPDQMVRIKGSDKPVKLGDHVRGFQSEFTKAAQRAADLQRQLAEREKQLSEFKRQQEAAGRATSQNGRNAALDALRALPYLKGEEAAQVVEQIENSFYARDQILLAALKQVQQLQGVVQKLNRTHTTSSFESKISKFTKDAGLGEGWIPAVKSLYLSYEPDGLDQEFPQILSEYVEGQRKLLEGERQEKVRQARPAPFIPGKGGNTGPTKPLEIKPNASAKELADLLWSAQMGGGDET